jgi:hypothetical protein
MRLEDFVFASDASITVIMRKPLNAVGTLFSLDTASLLNAELAISFEGPGSEIRVYNQNQDALFNLSLTSDNWIVLGFSWTWVGGDMTFTLSIDKATETISIGGLLPFRDLPNSSHIWGNSRLTQLGITRLFETFLKVYIHSIHIKGNLSGNWPPYVDLSHHLPGLWNCAFDAFFDEGSQSCLPCASNCSEGCIRAGPDNCKCFDIECANCRDMSEDSDCLSCGLLTSFAQGSSTPCDCKLGFSRDTENGA